MSKVCETAFFAATKTGADIFVPKGAIFADDDPITVGRDAHFVSTNDADTPGAVQLNTPDGTPGFPRVEDDGTVTLGPGTTLDPVVGVVAHAGETYYTLERVTGVSFTADQKQQIETLIESGDTASAQKIILAELAEASSTATPDASSDAGTTPTPESSGQAPAKKAAPAKKVAAKKP